MSSSAGTLRRRRAPSPSREERSPPSERRSRSSGFASGTSEFVVRLFQSAIGVGRTDPKREAMSFSKEFRDAYGDASIRFLPEAYRDALRRAHQEHKFLLVYLHAHEHEDVEGFVKDTLSDARLSSFVAENFVCWGGDVRRSEACKLSTTLGATSYPFLALLMSHSSTRTSVILRQVGCCESSYLMQTLMRANEEQGAMLVALRAEEEERVRNRQLREEQDAAYLASLEEDRKREMEKEELRRKQEDEKRKAEEEQARLEAVRLEEERRMEEKAKERARIREEKARMLMDEPEEGDGVTTIAIKMPDGSRKHRRFHVSASVGSLYDYVDSLEELDSVQYQLFSNFPRCSYGRELEDKTLEEVGLCPNALLFLQPEDA